MKKITSMLLAAVLIILLTACGHEHVWQAATCTSPKICPDCGETEGEALGHKWADATCTDAKVCEVCLATMGSPLGHSWEDATCTEAKTCSMCGETEGSELGHTWNPATCTISETCEVCGIIQGEPLGHNVEVWNIIEDSTCSAVGTESGVCINCNEEIQREVEMKEHTPSDWVVTVQPTIDEDGTRIKTCKVCEKELESESFTLTPEEIEANYKRECQSIPYDSLARSPGDYEGELVKYGGRVVQVCSEASSPLYYSTYRVAINGSYSNVMYIYVDNYGSGSRILEDDWITFYGEFDGLYSYTTVMGAQMTIPSVKVQYVD